MIKMFGWESKIERQVDEKREEELAFVRKKRLWDLVNGTIKPVTSTLALRCPDHTNCLPMQLSPTRISGACNLWHFCTQPP